MPFWQRFLVLVVAMLAVSYVFALIWQSVLGFSLPGYVSGVVGGLIAVPLWDLLKKAKPKKQ